MRASTQAGSDTGTDSVALDQESTSSSRAASPFPWIAGECPTVVRWFTKNLGEFQKDAPSRGGKKGGSAQKITYAVVGGLLGIGPGIGAWHVLVDGKLGWQGEAMWSSSSPITLSLNNGATLTIYPGTDDQLANARLNQFEFHGRYPGVVYCVYDGPFGSGGQSSPPTVKVYWRRKPQQSVITGQASAFAGYWSANGAACAAEILTSYTFWSPLKASDLNAATFQAEADGLMAETVGGDPDHIESQISPLITDTVTVYDLLKKIGLITGLTFRYGEDGRIEAKRWRRRSLSGVAYTTLEPSDFTVIPKSGQDINLREIVSHAEVTFRNSARWQVTDVRTVPNAAAANTPGVALTPKKFEAADMIALEEDAARMGEAIIATANIPAPVMEFNVRAAKCVNPSGTPIRPGDYFAAPVGMDPESPTLQVVVFRCTKRRVSFRQDVQLEAVREVLIPMMPVGLSSPEPAAQVKAEPPVAAARMISLPPTSSNPVVTITPLICRPSDIANAVWVSYASSLSGDYQDLARVGFALPASLGAAITSSSSSVRLALLANDAAGSVFTRDRDFLANWSGGVEEGRDNQLLIFLVKLSGGAIAKIPGTNRDYIEALSVSGPPSVVAANTYDAPVIRGVLGTAALDFSGAWGTVEAWVLPKKYFAQLEHADFASLVTSGAAGYFRAASDSRVGIYDPAEAYEQRQALASAGLALREFSLQPNALTHWPALSFNFPGSFIAPASSIATEPAPGVIRVRCTPPAGVTVARFVWYRSASNSFASASAIGTSGDPLFDDISVTSGATYYYWVACLDVAGNASAVAGPTSAVAAPDPVDGVPGAANYISNSDFLSNYSGWYATYHSTAATQTIGRADPASGFGLVGGGSVFSGITGIEAAGAVFDIDSSSIFPVRVGQRYQFSAYMSPVRLASAKCMLAWYDSTGNYISEVSGSSIGSEYVGGSNLSDYGRSFGFATAPAGAAQAKFFIRAVCDGVQSNPEMFATRCFCGEATINQTQPSSWAAKAEKGDSGTDATSRRLIASAASIARSTAGVLTPASVTFSAQSQTGTAAPTTYAGRWIVAETTDGSTWTDVYTSGGDEGSITRTPGGSAKAIRARLYLAGGTATKIDETTIPIVNDGQNGADGVGRLGSVEDAGTVSSTTWALVTPLQITITVPAGTRILTFTGTVSNASGSTRNIAYGIGVDGAGGIVIDDDTTVAAGLTSPTFIMRKQVDLSAGVHTFAMYAYSFGTASNVVVTGLLTIE